MARYDPVDDYIPNQTNAPKPYTPIITSAKAPNWLSLDERPTKPPRGGKRRRGGGGNLMDTGPDDAAPARQLVEQLEEANNPLESGLSQGVQNASAPPAPSGSPVAGPSGPSGAPSAPGGVPEVGFRPRQAPTFAEAAAPVAAPAAPPAPQAPPRPRRPSNLLDTGPDDDSHVSQARSLRDAQGNVYQEGSAADPYASQYKSELPFGLGGALDSARGAIPFPGVTGALLGGVSGFSNRNLDKIQQRSSGEEGYDPRYSYGETPSQRFGTSPGLFPGSTVYSGPDQIYGIAGVNKGIEGSVAGAQQAQAAIAKAEELGQVYQSPTGQTYYGGVAQNKQEADERAQAQGYATAVTDTSGKAVTQTGTDKVVGAGPKIQDDNRESEREESGGGK